MAQRANNMDGSLRETLTGRHAGKWRVQYIQVDDLGRQKRLSRLFDGQEAPAPRRADRQITNSSGGHRPPPENLPCPGLGAMWWSPWSASTQGLHGYRTAGRPIVRPTAVFSWLGRKDANEHQTNKIWFERTRLAETAPARFRRYAPLERGDAPGGDPGAAALEALAKVAFALWSNMILGDEVWSALSEHQAGRLTKGENAKSLHKSFNDVWNLLNRAYHLEPIHAQGGLWTI